MREKRRPRIWLVVLMTAIGTLALERLVLFGLLTFSPPGPNRLTEELDARLEKHFKALGFEHRNGGIGQYSVGNSSSVLSLEQAYEVSPPDIGARKSGSRMPEPRDVERLFEAIAATDRFMGKEGFLPCLGNPVIIPGYAKNFGGNSNNGPTLFDIDSGIPAPRSRTFMVYGQGNSGTASTGETLTVVLLRYRLRKIDEAECAIVFVLDRLQGRLGAGIALDGQRNGLWGKLESPTSSFSLQLLDESRNPVLHMSTGNEPD